MPCFVVNAAFILNRIQQTPDPGLCQKKFLPNLRKPRKRTTVGGRLCRRGGTAGQRYREMPGGVSALTSGVKMITGSVIFPRIGIATAGFTVDSLPERLMLILDSHE